MRFLASLITGILLLPLPAFAGPCDALFKFDGNLADAGGNGLNGQFVDSKGEPVAAVGEFVPGRTGQALRLDGETTVFSELNLQTETCPQVSITAWIFLEGFPKNAHMLLSTGHGRGPRIAVSSSNLSAWGGSNEIRAGLAVRPGIWIFVAGVWDYTADIHRLYWRHRSMEEPLGENSRPPQEGLWIGAYAYGSSMMSRANGILIDDLQVHGKALSEDEINAIRDAELKPERGVKCNCDGTPASGQSNVTRDPLSFPSCSSDNDCSMIGGLPGACYSVAANPARCYQRCAADNDCANGNLCLDVVRPGGELDGVCSSAGNLYQSESSLSSGAIESLQEARDAGRGPEIGYASEEEALAAAEQRERDRQQADSESQAAPVSDGKIRLASDSVLSGLTGTEGLIKERVDLDFAPINRIMLWEMADKPCLLKVRNGDFEQATIRCGMTPSPGLPKRIWRDGRWGVTSIRVGNNINPLGKKRVKGVWAEWTKFDDAGGLSAIKESDAFQLVHFGDWQEKVSCPTGHVATGLEGNFYPGRFPTQNTDRLTGLRLICRQVLSGREEA